MAINFKPLQSIAQRTPLRFTLRPPWLFILLLGTICFCPWVAMTSLHWVLLGFTLVVSSPGKSTCGLTLGSVVLIQEVVVLKAAHLEKVPRGHQEISGASTAHPPGSHEHVDLLCRQRLGLSGHFALEQSPLGGDRYQSSLLGQMAFATCWILQEKSASGFWCGHRFC